VDVSLVICTRDRCKQLVRCLQFVRDIRFDRHWELIIVDNGSVDQTATVIHDFIETTSTPVRYLFESKFGKSIALNTALRIAHGQILAFTDDDCYPAPDFLSRVWSAFDDPLVGFISGRIILHDPMDHPITINESTTALIYPARSFIHAGAVIGANMAFRRKILLDIGGFDPSFGPGALIEAAEDTDAAGRVSARGWQGKYCPDVVVRHHHGRKASDAPRMWKSYGIGVGGYHMKLLLQAHELSWFARGVYHLRSRYRFSRTMVLWEPVGAARYARLWLLQSLRRCFGKAIG
jgi:glycosyltransferase involved in cell wall biosynthesis